MYDCIVVGAGPAGAFSAYLLAQNGFRTLLLDKAVLPRYKTCGGGLPYKTIRSIPFDLQVMVDPEETPHLLSTKPSGASLLISSPFWKSRQKAAGLPIRAAQLLKLILKNLTVGW